MDISLIPLHIYKIPKDCTEILITPYIMFTKQTIAQSQPNHDNETTDPKTESEINVENCESIDTSDENVNINAIGVIGCNTTALRIGEDSVSELRSFIFITLYEPHNISILSFQGIQQIIDVKHISTSR